MEKTSGSNYSKTSDELIKENIKMAHVLSWHYHARAGRFIDIDDLVQIALVGLVEAAQKFKPRVDGSFKSYASMRMRGSIIDHLRKQSNLCRNTIAKKKKSDEIIRKIESKTGKKASAEEISKSMGISLEEYQSMQSELGANVLQSLDEVYDEFSLWFADLGNTPEAEFNELETREQLKIALKKLSERESLLLQLIFVEEFNVHEVSEILDISIGRVSQVKKEAVSKLREHFKDLNLIQEN